jgi:tRNA(Ile)-lysidine synthetase-like protein
MTQPAKTINLVLHNLRKMVKSDRLVICCSGGADSMALLFCAQKVFDNILVMHVVHDMRSQEESLHDRNCVKSYCDKHNLDFQEYEITLRCKLNQPASEQDYREERYHKISSECLFFDYPYAATGHHADDQLETLLMKICRGSGIRGLSGIKNEITLHGVTFVRPLINLTKSEIYEICNLNKIPYVEDNSNTDQSYTRNKIRQQVLPVLKDLFPSCAKQAVKLARIAEATQELVQDRLNDLAKFERSNSEIATDALRLANSLVVYEWFRKACFYQFKDFNIDALNNEEINKVIDTIKERKSKKFVWQNGLIVTIDADFAKVSRIFTH